MALLVKIDGVSYRRPEDAKISVFDHGFLFGDSVYEVVRTHGGRPYQVGPHLVRLRASARRISLELGFDAGDLEGRIADAVSECACEGEAYVRLIVTRGQGALNIDPASCRRPTLVIFVKDLPGWAPHLYREGISLRLVSTIRNTRNTVDPGIKTGNYLNNVLAIIEAKKAGAEEALMQNVDGHLTECTTSNLFFVEAGTLCTPSLEAGILSGITRSDVIRRARETGIVVREGSFPPDALRRASEAFITSTTRGIMPVKSLDGEPLGVSSNRPVMDRLQALLQAEVDAFIAAPG